MSERQYVRVDKIIWFVPETSGIRQAVPLCPVHHLRLQPWPENAVVTAMMLKCEDCKDIHSIPRMLHKEKEYVINRIDAKVFKGMKVLNLDDEATPVAKAKAKSADNKYFVTAQLMDSKRGLQAIVYAGETGNPRKVQMFVEPLAKRLSFDPNDLNPADVFLEIRGTFDDGSSHSIEKKLKES